MVRSGVEAGRAVGAGEHAARNTKNRTIARAFFMVTPEKKSGRKAAFFELAFDATGHKATNNLFLESDIDYCYR